MLPHRLLLILSISNFHLLYHLLQLFDFHLQLIIPLTILTRPFLARTPSSLTLLSLVLQQLIPLKQLLHNFLSHNQSLLEVFLRQLIQVSMQIVLRVIDQMACHSTTLSHWPRRKEIVGKRCRFVVLPLLLMLLVFKELLLGLKSELLLFLKVLLLPEIIVLDVLQVEDGLLHLIVLHRCLLAGAACLPVTVDKRRMKRTISFVVIGVLELGEGVGARPDLVLCLGWSLVVVNVVQFPWRQNFASEDLLHDFVLVSIRYFWRKVLLRSLGLVVIDRLLQRFF